MKITSLSLLTSLSITTFGMTKDVVHKNINQKVEELSENIGAITTNTALGEKSITTTSAWPKIEGKDSYISFDVLLWKAKIAGTAFAATNNQLGSQEPIEGSIKDNSLHWDFGFKIGAGKNLNYDTWGLFGEFTYFKADGSSTVKGNIENAIIPLKGPFASSVQSARSQMLFRFFNLDIGISRHYFISRTLALNPFLGIRNTWNLIKQEISFSGGPTLRNNTAKTFDKSKMWGMGPQVGIDTNWYIGKGFHGFGLFSTSLLYSYFQVKQDSFITISQDNDLFITQKNHRFIPNIDLNLGIGWSSYLNDKKNYLEINLGYEAQYYWRLNEMLSLYELRDSIRMQNIAEDIAIYGVTLEVKVFF